MNCFNYVACPVGKTDRMNRYGKYHIYVLTLNFMKTSLWQHTHALLLNTPIQIRTRLDCQSHCSKIKCSVNVTGKGLLGATFCNILIVKNS